ncbi:MAG TPA: hypothetical protein VJC18_07440, partial [bacterium]|nr:hypothetical protein [bacterium]
ALTEISPRDAEETKTALALTQTLSTFTNDLLRRLEALSQWDLSQPDQELLSCLVSTQQLYLISPSKILQRLLSQQTTTNTSALAQQWGQLESLWTHKITSPLLS